MRQASSRPRGWFANVLVGPVVLLALAVTLLAAVGLRSAAHQSDEISVERQTREVELALTTAQDDLAQSQAGIAIWDLAQIELRRPRPDWTWFDNNIGIYLNYIFSHHADFILDGHDRPVYGASLGERISPLGFSRFRSALQPMVDAVRGRSHRPANSHERLPHQRPNRRSTARTSPRAIHATDLVLLDGHPAVVSVMRMIPDTPAVKPTPGIEPLLVSIRFLDSGFSRDLLQLKLIANARISPRAITMGEERAIPLVSSRGGRIGYFIWRPEMPGSVLLASMAPIAAVAVVLIVAALILLALGLAKTMRANAEAHAGLKSAHAHLQAKEEQAQYRALHDDLTGLPNRLLFDDAVERALGETNTNGSLAVMLLDLDRFKQVNDTLGHHAGDLLLREVAVRLQANIGREDIVARLGGDEFALLVRSCSTQAALRRLAGSLIQALDQPFHLSGTDSFVGVSVGIIAKGRTASRSELMRRADLAMYQAKRHGSGGFRFFKPQMEEAAQRRSVFERDLRAALAARDQLFVEFQPRVAAGTQQVVGFEALLRWRHPSRGIVGPQDFVPIAEETGLVEEIGMRVLEQTVNVARQWPGLSFAVNVSPVQLRNPAFPDRARGCVELAGVQPRQIEFEITEGVLLADDRVSTTGLAKLREAGFAIALDDFGTGYSSLNYLTRFKVDKIKIDRSFIDRLESAPDAPAIICAVVALGRAMGLSVAAEGVESAEQRDFLTAAGCDELQGFYFSPGMTADAMIHYLDGECASPWRNDAHGRDGEPAGRRVATHAPL